MNTTHEHTWRYLRQEEKNIGYPETDASYPTWKVYDVYFCEGCLEYRRVHVRTEVPGRDPFAGDKRRVTWGIPW